jgi:hypothetical protein
VSELGSFQCSRPRCLHETGRCFFPMSLDNLAFSALPCLSCIVSQDLWNRLGRKARHKSILINFICKNCTCFKLLNGFQLSQSSFYLKGSKRPVSRDLKASNFGIQDISCLSDSRFWVPSRRVVLFASDETRLTRFSKYIYIYYFFDLNVFLRRQESRQFSGEYCDNVKT